MAYTKIKQIKTTLSKAIDYIENPEKTDNQLLVSGYNCEPYTAAIEFEMTKSVAEQIYKKQPEENNVLAYHMIQSFDVKDNITPEEAHKIGKEFADSVLEGKYEYVISTHIDKGHIHNHIIFNSTSFYDLKKFHNKDAWKVLREISDRLCKERGLSIIPHREYDSTKYENYYGRFKVSNTQDLKKKIDKAIAMSKTYDEFKKRLLDIDGIITNDAGKHITFKAPTMQRVRRGKTIGENYTKEAIIKRIESTAEYGKNITFADTIELHTRRVAIENTKKITDALSLIRRENIKSYDDMQARVLSIEHMASDLKAAIDELNIKVTYYKKIAGYLETYNKHSEIYEEYLGLKGKKKEIYRREHEQEIEAYKYAETMLENHNVNSNVDLDKVWDLIREKNEIVAEKTKNYNNLKSKVDNLKEAVRVINEINVKRSKEMDRNKGLVK